MTRVPTIKYILIFLVPTVLLAAITTFLPEPESADYWETDIIIIDLLIAVIAVPLIETLLFQSLIIEIICKVIKRPGKNIIIAVVVSSVAFAFNHTYSTLYVIYTLCGGIIYALAYYFGRYRKEGGIILVFLLHSFDNLLISLYNLCL